MIARNNHIFTIQSHRQWMNNNAELALSHLLTVILSKAWLTTSRSRLWTQHTSLWVTDGTSWEMENYLEPRFSGHLVQAGHTYTYRCTWIHSYKQRIHLLTNRSWGEEWASSNGLSWWCTTACEHSPLRQTDFFSISIWNMKSHR